MNEDIQLLKERVSYCPNTGIIRWLKHTYPGRVNKIADYKGTSGYRRLSIGRKTWLSHRVAFALMTGKFPENDVDHINRIKDDNRWANLRDTDRSTNLLNQVNAQKSSKTKLLGVSRYKVKQGYRYAANIVFRGKRIHIGCYPTDLQASEAYTSYKRKLGEDNAV